LQISASKPENEEAQEFTMLNTSKAFSSFSVNDIQKAKEFYGKTLGRELSSGPEGTLVVPLSGGTKALMYPKANQQPATFTVLNFPVESVEKTVDELSQRALSCTGRFLDHSFRSRTGCAAVKNIRADAFSRRPFGSVPKGRYWGRKALAALGWQAYVM
jgi:catechol 2,3-dioxygenase-like lactoylglutathione lyase family enzyme